MTTLVLIQNSTNDIVRLSRIADRKVTSKADLDTNELNGFTLGEWVNHYRVNDIFTIDEILNMYIEAKGEVSVQFEIVESGEWKYQRNEDYVREVIISHNKKLYAITESRSGSSFSDWNYCYAHTIREVEKNEVTKTEYKTKATQ